MSISTLWYITNQGLHLPPPSQPKSKQLLSYDRRNTYRLGWMKQSENLYTVFSNSSALLLTGYLLSRIIAIKVTQSGQMFWQYINRIVGANKELGTCCDFYSRSLANPWPWSTRPLHFESRYSMYL